MTDADSAIADYEATLNYQPEAGEAPAHTFHWIYTMRALGELQTGTGAITKRPTRWMRIFILWNVV